MPNAQLIKPRLPGGFKDLLPEEFAARQFILDKTVEVYRSFGFQPLETSCVEHLETLSGSDETSKQIYRLFNQEPDFTGESLSLRFDLTVPLARVLASNRSAFNLPFKRYQTGYVWRGERQQKGRFKQFLQCDADIVGTDDPAADAEIVLLIDAIMQSLGLKNFTIRLNDRRILNGFILSLGLSPADINSFLRILDKLDKIGWGGVAVLLSDKTTRDENGQETAGLGLSPDKIELVGKFITAKDNLKQIAADFAEIPALQAGVASLRKIITLAAAAGVKSPHLQFDPSLARGLDYYTGPVFETILNDIPNIGSVMSGGRYDNLMERFSRDSLPATGISLGVDRLLAALQELNLLQTTGKSASALFVPLDDAALEKCFSLASELRIHSIPCEIYLGENKKLKKQLTYANQKGISICLILGEVELVQNVIQLKNLISGEQRNIAISDLFREISKIVTSDKQVVSDILV